MADRHRDLQELEILPPANGSFGTPVLSNETAGFEQSLAFSGYGDFTPIKVTAGTALDNADLERGRK